MNKLKWKKKFYRTWKKGLTPWEEYKNVNRVRRDVMRKAQASLELKVAREVKDKKCFFRYTGGKKPKTKKNTNN